MRNLKHKSQIAGFQAGLPVREWGPPVPGLTKFKRTSLGSASDGEYRESFNSQENTQGPRLQLNVTKPGAEF